MLRFVLIASGLALVGCNNNSEAKGSASGSTPPVSGSASMPSARSAGSASALTAKPANQDELAKWFAGCWQDWEASRWGALQNCYIKDASFDAPGSGMHPVAGAAAIVELMKSHRAAFPDEKAQPQLALANGHKLIGITLLTGKNTGPMKTPKGELPATGKSIGLYMAQVLTFDDAGKITHEEEYLDSATLEHQLKPHKAHPVRPAVEKLTAPMQTVVAKDSAAETANLAAVKQYIDAFNRHDDKAAALLISDDVVWSDEPQPRDMTKQELLAHLRELWKGFPDLKLAVTSSIAGGDYVATTATFEGTNNGDLPMMHLHKTGKPVHVPLLAVDQVSGGRIKAAWIFYQSRELASQLGHARTAGEAP